MGIGPECLRGAYNRCEWLEVIGVQRVGSLAGRFVTRAGKVHRVPTSTDPATWALVEPVAVACHAVERSGAEPGELALILGAGVIGLSIALALNRRDPDAIIVAEPREGRRRRAFIPTRWSPSLQSGAVRGPTSSLRRPVCPKFWAKLIAMYAPAAGSWSSVREQGHSRCR